VDDSVEEPFAVYLARCLIVEKRFREGVPAEAARLAEASDIALTYADFGLALACIVDRESDPDKKLSFTQEELIAVGRACLEYTGTMNGTKMPVGITLYEVGHGPPREDDKARLEALQSTMPGFKKVAITCFYLDMKNKVLWSSAPLGALLRIGHRAWLERLLKGPRKGDRDLFPADAVLPRGDEKPLATAIILSLLVGVFAVEQIAQSGGSGSGLLGVNVGTLFALGGMNARAVLDDGQWYRLFSAALLHGDAFHLLLNGVALGLAGFFLEAMLGRAWLVALFAIGALGGSLLGLVVNPDNLVSVGASGAVMGLLAAALVSSMRFPAGALRTQVQLPLLQFLIPSLIPLATHTRGGRIDYAAHFGGAIVGALAGYALMRIWPKTEELPRFPRAARGLAVAGVACFALSGFFVKQNYAAYAEALTSPIEALLVDQSRIPKDSALAMNSVEEWGKDRPRDPRVRLFRGLRLLDQGDARGAEAELRAALDERQILDRAFADKKLEAMIRLVLCEELVKQGRIDEAKREAEPVCNVGGGAAPNGFKKLGLCE
jgi:rhomboid protease GluP